MGIKRERDSGDTNWLAGAGFEYNFFLDDKPRVALLPGAFIDFIDEEGIVYAVIAKGDST